MRFQKIVPLALAASLVSAQENITAATNATVPLANEQLTTFWTLLQEFNLLSGFSSIKNITLLAPSNQALSRLNASGVALTPELVTALMYVYIGLRTFIDSMH
jgi:uncharacterized surface protein with fasciclin (FAS1) repeats